MSGEPVDKIILCQPDNTKGCSLCCGLFNLSDISRESLETYLEKGANREKEYKAHEGFIITSRVRNRYSHICPFQGFVSPGKPGCIVHPMYAGTDGRDRSLFARKICESFFCPAHSILSPEEKKFLIYYVEDWYMYTVAITDPESFSYIFNFIKENYRFPCKERIFSLLVQSGLIAHSENLSAYEGEIFFYSIPEYNLNKMNFCIMYREDSREHVLTGIRECARRNGVTSD